MKDEEKTGGRGDEETGRSEQAAARLIRLAFVEMFCGLYLADWLALTVRRDL